MTPNDPNAFPSGPDQDSSNRVRPGDPASAAVASALRTAIDRLRAAGASAQGGEVEGVHRVRTSARRLRSELRAFRNLIDAEWGEALERELRWLGRVLGDVRDLDVLRAHFEDACDDEGEGRIEKGRLKPLFDALHARHEIASAAMREALQGGRCRRLFESLEQAAERAPLREEADEACKTVLPPLVAKSWRRLKKDVEDLEADSADSAFHEVRKRAKRARYTAELVAPILGRKTFKKAVNFIRRTTAVQDALGEHQDMTVAIAELERIRAQHPDDLEFQEAARALLARLHRTSDDALAAFFALWPKLGRKKTRRWFKRRG